MTGTATIKKHLLHSTKICFSLYLFVVFLGSMNEMCATDFKLKMPLKNTTIMNEDKMDALYGAAADEFIKVIKENPRALIILPTGSTPVKLYKILIERFKADPKLDLSKATFFNLDEYIGLENGHPLSYAYYMKTHFYGPLRSIDSSRAPQSSNCYLPQVHQGETPSVAAERYENTLSKFIQQSQFKKVDLAILGVGGAYPETDATGNTVLKGGHIAFNEPGTSVDQRTRVVTLTDKTKLDTRFRFSSLASLIKEGEIEGSFKTEVPNQAISMGIANILEAQKILILATSEDKAPVVEHALLYKEPDRFPVSYLQDHGNVHWYVDDAAATLIINQKAPYETLPDDFKTMIASKADLSNLPHNKNILVISPHPDDDVICMSATLLKLLQNNNNVHILYAVSGSNAVRTTDAIYQELLPVVGQENPQATDAELVLLTKEKTRETEATRATALLGFSPGKLTFFNANYYKRRGVPGLPPLKGDDIQNMKQILEKIKPEIIFFAAENDPHGAHGLSTELVARAAKELSHPQKLTFYGYRGAYAEWPLHQAKELMIVPFDQETMDRKIQAIKAHQSQLDPLFPSFDPRPFWQRAYERNKDSGNLLKQLTETSFPPYAEIFKTFSFEQFTNHYVQG